jgi:serine/threonine protein kinase
MSAHEAIRTGADIDGWTVDEVLTYDSPMWVAAHRGADPDTRATLKIWRVDDDATAGATDQSDELLALESLTHAGLPRVLTSGRTDDLLYTAFAEVAGETLSDRVVSGPTDWKQAITWLHAIASVLDHMHRSGWVHRSVSPQTVFVAVDDSVHLMGLETARSIAGGVHPPVASGLAYCAPEVLVDPDTFTPRADLYAFGVLAYELLTGEPAFPATAGSEAADDTQALVERKNRSTTLDPGPALPDWVRHLVRNCTHAEREMRLPDMGTVVAWLDASRAEWAIPRAGAHDTPATTPREGLPPLDVHPTPIDTEALARAIAREALSVQARTPPERAMLLTMSGVMGCAAGLALSALVVIFVELSRI